MPVALTRNRNRNSLPGELPWEKWSLWTVLTKRNLTKTQQMAMLALVGRLDGEGALLAVAEAWQRQTDWHLTRPKLTR